MANFCTNCGHAVDAGTAFCKYCGAPLSPQPQAAPAQPAQPQQWSQPAQPQQAQWQQPAQQPQQWTPPASQQPAQWQQPAQQPAGPPWTPPASQQGQWTPPRAGENGWQAHPGAAVGTGAPQWNVHTTSRSPSARLTEAWENYQDSRQRSAGVPQSGIPAPGWSERINDPELLAALDKQKRASRRFGAVIVPLPLIGFLIYGAVSDKMEIGQALIYGAIVSVIFLIFALIGGKKPSGKNAYEAIVVDKQTRQRRRNNGKDEDGGRDYTYYTELTTVVQTSAGERKKIVEADDGRTFAWDYLQIGERFRYHPQLAFPYELYDKSHAPCLYCPVCSRKNPVTADRCGKCKAPLLK